MFTPDTTSTTVAAIAIVERTLVVHGGGGGKDHSDCYGRVRQLVKHAPISIGGGGGGKKGVVFGWRKMTKDKRQSRAETKKRWYSQEAVQHQCAALNAQQHLRVGEKPNIATTTTTTLGIIVIVLRQGDLWCDWCILACAERERERESSSGKSGGGVVWGGLGDGLRVKGYGLRCKGLGFRL